MLDIRFIRENKDIIIAAAKKKRIAVDIDELLKVDEERRVEMQSAEKLRAEQNEMSKKIAYEKDFSAKSHMIEEMKVVKEELGKIEVKLEGIMKTWQSLMLAVPNIPDISVPEGEDESKNVEVHVWGDRPNFSFEPKDHLELMLKLGMVDIERGTKVHGFRGYFLKDDGAELSWAVWNYARAFFGKRNFTHVVAPAVVRKEYFYATGHLPKEAEDLFKTQDDDYLAGTAEVPMMAYHAGEILRKEDLPKRYLAFSPCYRREAGSHGKDTKGLIRVHEFYKLEQLIISEADHAQSEKIHEEINRNFEEFIESLGLPYRRLLICGGDLSASKVKQYDTEVWFPSQKAYREASSASYFHDFQTRRFNIRYDGGDKKLFAHSANSTAAATPRLMAAIIENYQQPDGKIVVPAVLRPYIGKEVWE